MEAPLKIETLFQRLPFIVITLLSLGGYLIFRFWFPLSPHFNQAPLPDVRSFSPSLWGAGAYALLLLALFGLYGLAYRRAAAARLRLGVIVGTAVLLALPLLQTFPINATDIYRYVIRGRVSSVHDADPFARPPAAFPEDPFLPLAGEWGDETSPYGPLWELTAAGVTAVTQNNLYAGLLSFKGLGLLAHLTVTILIWRLLDPVKPGRRSGYTLLWAWNPALLLMFVVDGHNDVLMLFWLLLGWWLMRRGWPAAGFLLIVLAALTKPIALLTLPFFWLAGWCQQPDAPSRIRFLLLSGVGSLTAVFLAFLPFDSPVDLTLRLAREASNIPGFSPATLILLIAGWLERPLSFQLVANLARIPFALLVLWLLWRTWHGRSPVRSAADIFLGYIWQALSFRLWYMTWIFPWLLVDESDNQTNALPYRLRVGLWLLLTTQLSVLIYGHLRVYALGGSHLLAHLIGVPFVFVLPFLLARFPRDKKPAEMKNPLKLLK